MLVPGSTQRSVSSPVLGAVHLPGSSKPSPAAKPTPTVATTAIPPTSAAISGSCGGQARWSFGGQNCSVTSAPATAACPYVCSWPGVDAASGCAGLAGSDALRVPLDPVTDFIVPRRRGELARHIQRHLGYLSIAHQCPGFGCTEHPFDRALTVGPKERGTVCLPRVEAARQRSAGQLADAQRHATSGEQCIPASACLGDGPNIGPRPAALTPSRAAIACSTTLMRANHTGGNSAEPARQQSAC